MTWPPLVCAHLTTTGLGSFYDGALHSLTAPGDLLSVIALAMFAGLRGARAGRCVLFALPVTWLAASLIGFAIEWDAAMPAATAGITIVCGALVAADVELRMPAILGVATTLGAFSGGITGGDFAVAKTGTLAVAGAVSVLVVIISIVAGQASTLDKAPTRIAVRVAGSWIAAIGLLMFGWSVRGA